MLGQKNTPSWRLRLLPLLMVLVAAACTLNSAPGGPQVTITGVPVVQIAGPQPNATYLEGVSVNIQALISNAGADITKVDFSVDGASIAAPEKPNPTGGPAFSLSQPWSATGAGAHTITVTAYRADGSASQPASATISVVSSVGLETEAPTPEITEASSNDNGGDNADNSDAATVSGDNVDSGSGNDQAADNSDNSGSGNDQSSDKPTDEPKATETPSKPVATFKQGVNVRKGPGTVFEPPIGAFAAGQTADILGVSPDKAWYKVRYYNADGWVFGQLLDIAGDTSNLPVDAGPPTPVPTPIPPTAVPATDVPAAPQSNANLVAGLIRLDPNPPTCKQTFKVSIDIANLGDEDTSTTGSFTITDSDGEKTSGSIPKVKKGETVRSDGIKITVKTGDGKDHTITVVLNGDNTIPEKTHDDNTATITYKLGKSDDC